MAPRNRDGSTTSGPAPRPLPAGWTLLRPAGEERVHLSRRRGAFAAPCRIAETPQDRPCGTIRRVNALDLVAALMLVLAIVLGVRSGALPQMLGLLAAAVAA